MRNSEVKALDIYSYIRNCYLELDSNINCFDHYEILSFFENKTITEKQIKALCKIRYWYLVTVLNKMSIIESMHPACADTTIITNLSFISNLGSDYAKRRNINLNEFGVNVYYFHEGKVKTFANALLRIDEINKTKSNSEILYIGARTEGELFYFSTFGFQLRKITACDLYSYSSFIDIGDMHRLEYKANSIDICLLTHCIYYSEDSSIVFKQVAKVLKPGGFLMFSYGETAQKNKNENEIIDKPRTGALNHLAFEDYVSIAIDTKQFKEVEFIKWKTIDKKAILIAILKKL